MAVETHNNEKYFEDGSLEYRHCRVVRNGKYLYHGISEAWRRNRTNRTPDYTHVWINNMILETIVDKPRWQ